jgi:hypothetical protein
MGNQAVASIVYLGGGQKPQDMGNPQQKGRTVCTKLVSKYTSLTMFGSLKGSLAKGKCGWHKGFGDACAAE